MNWDLLIIIGSSLAAALSFAAFAYPFLKKTEQKERYKNVIEKKRKELFMEAKSRMENKGQANVSAKDSVAAFFKVQQLAGEFGEKIRIQMLQAGIRDPMAPIIFIIAQAVLPLFFALFAWFILANMQEPYDSTIQLLIILGAAGTGYKLPNVLVKNAAMKRSEELNLSFPDSLDMMLICIQGGIGIEQTINKVAEEVAEHSPVLAEELGILSAEMAMLSDRRTALSDFGKRVGGYGKSFATTLIQAEQYGTSMSQALRVMADELREIRMSKAEEKAMSLPPKLTVPMILFFLPALFIVILGPAAIQVMAVNG
jgi:tight adherence protein C